LRLAISRDKKVLELPEAMSEPERQPDLLLGVVRLHAYPRCVAGAPGLTFACSQLAKVVLDPLTVVVDLRSPRGHPPEAGVQPLRAPVRFVRPQLGSDEPPAAGLALSRVQHHRAESLRCWLASTAERGPRRPRGPRRGLSTERSSSQSPAYCITPASGPGTDIQGVLPRGGAFGTATDALRDPRDRTTAHRQKRMRIGSVLAKGCS
jgi:hypothetical protein